MKKRIKLIVSYDGTNYCGWQLQNNGVTIEEVLNRELSRLLKEPVAVIGASRTDSGVHALGNVAVFDTENPMAADKICLALNQGLPEDIRIQSSEQVEGNWHPRKANCIKTYEYRILNRRIALPTQRLYSYFCYFPLDVEKMRLAASFLVGEHDFKSFCTARSHVKDTVRTLYRLTIEKSGDLLIFRFCGSGFLYNMVRIMVGTLMKVGMGVYPPEYVAEILAARDRRKAGQTAPAKGLMLVGMEYEQELPQWHFCDNSDWRYHILQSHIKTGETAFFFIGRCKEEDWHRLVLRNIHHSFQNGASKVVLADLEKGRFHEGDEYGYYRIKAITPEEEEKAMGLLSQEEKEEVLKIFPSPKMRPGFTVSWYLAVDMGKGTL